MTEVRRVVFTECECLNQFNVLNNRVYGIYCNVITVLNENTHRLWGYGSVGQLLNIVLVTLRRAGY